MVISHGTNDFSFCRAAAPNQGSSTKKGGQNILRTGFGDTFMDIFCSKIFFQITAFMKRDVWGQAKVFYGRQWRIDGVLCTTHFPPLEEKFCYQTNISIRSIFIDGYGISYLAMLAYGTCRYVDKT